MLNDLETCRKSALFCLKILSGTHLPFLSAESKWMSKKANTFELTQIMYVMMCCNEFV